VVKHNAKTPTERNANEVFVARPVAEAQTWATTCVRFLLPTYLAQNPADGTAGPQGLTSELLATIIRETRAPTVVTPPTTPDKDTEARKKHFGLAQSAYDQLLVQCGLLNNDEDEMPNLWGEMAEKDLSTEDKNNVVRAALGTVKYKGAKIPDITPIIKMIRDHQFQGETTSTIHNVAKGLSPFAVAYMTDDDISAHNELTDALRAAMSTSVEDIQKSIKVKANVPVLFWGFENLLKTFTNLLNSIFGSNCPLLTEVEAIIDDLTRVWTRGETAHD